MEFFPAGSLHDRPDIHAFRQSWYGSHLAAMLEMPLRPTAAGPDVYRLLFLPTFSRPHAIRLTGRGGIWTAVCKLSDGLGGYHPGELVHQRRRGLSRTEARTFSRLLSRAQFWEAPSVDIAEGFDGTQTLLEGVRPFRYHVVTRWSPHGTDHARLVRFLLDLDRPEETA